jgi:hypothetical protein
MSLDGGWEELLEFFPSFASRSRNSASSRSKAAHRGQPVVVARSIIATPTYPNHLTLTKITLETVNGYRFAFPVANGPALSHHLHIGAELLAKLPALGVKVMLVFRFDN